MIPCLYCRKSHETKAEWDVCAQRVTEYERREWRRDHDLCMECAGETKLRDGIRVCVWGCDDAEKCPVCGEILHMRTTGCPTCYLQHVADSDADELFI